MKHTTKKDKKKNKGKRRRTIIIRRRRLIRITKARKRSITDKQHEAGEHAEADKQDE